MKELNVEELTLEQKIGQLIVARSIVDPDDYAFAMELIRNHALGGVQINPKPGARENYILPVREAADYPILIGADMEKGFQLGELSIPGNLAIGALDSEEASYRFAKVTAKQAKAYGYSMIWSPVVDDCAEDRPCSVNRCMSADRAQVSRLAIPYMKAFAECGIVGTAKHYPSCTDSYMDSHMSPSKSYRTKEEIMHGTPYVAMMKALGEDMTGIMSGHVICTKIDPDRPASLSKTCIDMIREVGFDGLILTDSFAMMGVLQDFGDENILGMAIGAGNDMLLPNYRIPLRTTYGYLLENYKRGLFSEKRLNEAVRRVLKAQERTMFRPVDLQVTDEDKAWIERINRDCICARTDAGVKPSIDRNGKHLFAIDTPNAYPSNAKAGINEIEFAPWWTPEKVAERLKKEYPNSEIAFFCEFPSRHEIENICYRATKAEDVVFITFCTSESYQGTDGLTQRACIMMEAVQSKTAAVVHFGNPYAMEKVCHVPRMLFGFRSSACVDNTLDVLAGKAEPKGNMPIQLKLK